jgi:sucrose phosphorylase
MKSNPGGSQDVYELNINYLDALASPDELADAEIVAAKALCAHAILLSLVGVPAIYYHSLFGSSGDPEAARRSGINRRINRARLARGSLAAQLLSDPRRRLVRDGIADLLRVRGAHSAFSPYQPQKVEILDNRVFAVHRGIANHDHVLCLANVSAESVRLPLAGTNLFDHAQLSSVELPAYGFVWLSPRD